MPLEYLIWSNGRPNPPLGPGKVYVRLFYDGVNTPRSHVTLAVAYRHGVKVHCGNVVHLTPQGKLDRNYGVTETVGFVRDTNGRVELV